MSTIKDFFNPIITTPAGAAIAAYALESALRSEVFRHTTEDWKIADVIWEETYGPILREEEWRKQRKLAIRQRIAQPPSEERLSQLMDNKETS